MGGMAELTNWLGGICKATQNNNNNRNIFLVLLI